MRYEFYYWPTIQGRGEYVRLALEEAGADYVDVGRERGADAIVAMLERKREKHPPYAPPFLKAGRLLIAQSANILFYLRRAPPPRAEGRSRTAVCASAAAHRHGLRRGDTQHSSPDRVCALL